MIKLYEFVRPPYKPKTSGAVLSKNVVPPNIILEPVWYNLLLNNVFAVLKNGI